MDRSPRETIVELNPDKEVNKLLVSRRRERISANLGAPDIDVKLALLVICKLPIFSKLSSPDKLESLLFEKIDKRFILVSPPNPEILFNIGLELIVKVKDTLFKPSNPFRDCNMVLSEMLTDMAVLRFWSPSKEVKLLFLLISRLPLIVFKEANPAKSTMG